MKNTKLQKIINTCRILFGIIFLNISLESLGAVIEVTFTPSIHSMQKWEGTLYAPTRIEVLRNPNESINEVLKANHSKECPYCMEVVKAQAKICKHCNKEL